MVCDECQYIPNTASPKATLRNVQIVNGGQTSRTLFHAFKNDPNQVSNIDILVRIVETKDRTISERISETANKQTPIRTRDYIPMIGFNENLKKNLKHWVIIMKGKESAF